MSTTWKAVTDGDAISAVDMNDNFDAAATLINAPAIGDYTRGALNRYHLPAACNSSGTVSLSGSDHTYTNSDSPYGSNVASSWTRINSAGGSGTSNDDFKIETNIDLLSGGIETPRNGVLVFFNGLIKNIENTAAAAGATGYHDVHAIFRLIVTDGSGNVTAVSRSERFADSELSWYSGTASSNLRQWKLADIGIRHLLTSNEVTDGTLTKIEVGVAVVQATSTTSIASKCVLVGCDLSYISLNNKLTEY